MFIPILVKHLDSGHQKPTIVHIRLICMECLVLEGL